MNDDDMFQLADKAARDALAAIANHQMTTWSKFPPSDTARDFIKEAALQALHTAIAPCAGCLTDTEKDETIKELSAGCDLLRALVGPVHDLLAEMHKRSMGEIGLDIGHRIATARERCKRALEAIEAANGPTRPGGEI